MMSSAGGYVSLLGAASRLSRRWPRAARSRRRRTEGLTWRTALRLLPSWRCDPERPDRCAGALVRDFRLAVVARRMTDSLHKSGLGQMDPNGVSVSLIYQTDL